MGGESDATRSIIDELNSRDVQVDQMEDESSFNRSIIDELHSSDIQGDQKEDKNMVLLEVYVLNFILRISKKIK